MNEIQPDGDAYLQVREIESCRGSNHVCLVDPFQGHTVDLVRASDEEEATRELFQEDDPLSLEPPSEENDNLTRFQASPEPGRVERLAVFLHTLDVLGWVILWCLLGRNESLFSIFWTTDRNLLVMRDVLFIGGGGLFEALLCTPFLGFLGTRLAFDVRCKMSLWVVSPCHPLSQFRLELVVFGLVWLLDSHAPGLCCLL